MAERPRVTQCCVAVPAGFPISVGALRGWHWTAAEFADDGHDVVGCRVDVLSGGGPGESEAETGEGQGFADSERSQDVAGLEVARSAGRAGADRDGGEPGMEPVAGDMRNAHVQIVRQGVAGVAVADQVFDARLQASPEAVAEGGDALGLAVQGRLSEFAGGTESDGEWHGGGSGTEAVFLTTSFPEGLERNGGLLAADDEGSDPLGATELVSGEAEEIDRGMTEIDGDVSDSLGGVAMEPGTTEVADRREIGDGIDRSDFVIGPHDRNESGRVREGLFQQVRRDLAEGVGGEEGELAALSLEAAGGVEDRAVFDR